MRLDIYVGQHCENCQEALAIAAAARGIPSVVVRVIDWDDLHQTIPTQVIAVPTFVLDDHIVSLGNPDRQLFLARLRAQESRQERSS